LKNVSKPGPGELVKAEKPVTDPDGADEDAAPETTSLAANDIILREAGNILIDYSSLLKGQPVVSQR